MRQVLILTAFVILVGAILALPVLLPATRRILRRSQRARHFMRTVLALAALILSFAFVVLTQATLASLASATTSECQPLGSDVCLQASADMTTELWRRLLLPPPLRETCYIADSFVCDNVTNALQRTSEGWDSYLLAWGFGLLGMLVNLVVTHRFTRPGMVSVGEAAG